MSSHHRIGLRSWALATAAVAAISSPAFAQEARSFNIAAQPLTTALEAFGKQSGMEILFDRGQVAGKSSGAVKGSMAPGEALARMTAGTGMSVRQANGSTFVVSPGPQSAAAPAAAEPAQVSELTVTGSHIRGAPPASPLLVISRHDLEGSGQTTVVDALRALPENFGGGAGQGAPNTGADKLARNSTFASALNLRGLGNNATLVLIDGRRMAGSGTFGDFTDISTIPTSAVERVEVLLDGASALYGSDAVGGVVNIIMRKTFEGAETRILAGGATQGGAAQAQISQVFGKRWSGGGVIAAIELQHQDDLPGADRRFTANADLRPLGGLDQRQTNAFPGNILIIDPVTHALVPGFAIPTGQNGVGLQPGQLIAGARNLQNQRLGEDILPEQDMSSFYVAADQMFGDRLQVSGSARYSDRHYKSVQGAATSSLTVSKANPFFVSPIGATSESIGYSFRDDLPNPINPGSAKVLGLSLDGKLDLFRDWRAEAYATFAQEYDVSNNFNLINSLALNEALGNTADNPATAFSTAQNGFFNPFTGIPGSNSAAITKFIGSGLLNLHSRDRVWTANVQADGTLWTLPGGAVKLAVGAQSREEALYRDSVIQIVTATPVPQAITDLSRHVTAAFAELQIPIFGPENAVTGIQKLDLSIAGRVEHYETFGTSTNPKVGILWAPMTDLQVRATYGTSFRAPALRETSDPSAYSPSFLNLGGGKALSLILGGGNANLRPETATSWTFGADYRPSRWPGLTLSLTAYDIEYHNRIAQPVSTNLANALQDATLASFVTRISPTTSASDLALIESFLASPALVTLGGTFTPQTYGAIVDNRYVNTAKLHVEGLDFTGRYVFDLGGDRVGVGANASYMLKYDLQSTPTSPLVDRVNTVNFPETFHSRLTGDWTRRRLTLAAAFNYAGGYHDTLGVKIAAQPTLDFQARLAPAETGVLQGIAVLFNVRNVFDRDPPFYNNSVGVGYDAANGSPIGRFVSIQFTRAW
jgi:iron complex outermembrane receptor protein